MMGCFYLILQEFLYIQAKQKIHESKEKRDVGSVYTLLAPRLFSRFAMTFSTPSEDFSG